jgi:hypothetical protein
MRKAVVLLVAAGAFGCAVFASSTAKADVVIITGTPRAEERAVIIGHGFAPGPQAEGNIGSGFGTYGLGYGARLGYTLDSGVYLGGDVEHFQGGTAPGAGPPITFVGGEVGLKIFPSYRFEIRPYGFAGAAIPSGGRSTLAIQPGVVGAYHFGRAFVDVDARYFATPAPTAFAVMGGAGLSF